jgi:hypothetical protein
MKRRWRRLLLTLTAVLLALCLIVLASFIWLQTSGRLAALAQDLVQRLSGQEVHIDAIEFPSWNMAAFTGIRLQQRLGRWHMDLICPRLEVHYGLRGLLNKRVKHLRLLQPQIHIQAMATAASPDSPPLSRPATMALPVQHVTVQQGMLRLHWRDAAYEWRHIEASLQQRKEQQVLLTASGTLDENDATVHIQGEIPLNQSQPAGSWQLTTRALPLSRLAQALPDLLPPTLAITQGTLEATAQLEFHAQTLHGTLHAKVAHGHVQTDSLALHQFSLTSESRLEANPEEKSLRLEGTVSVHSEQATGPMALSATRLMLNTPLRFTYTPEQWQASLEATLQSQTLSARDRVQVHDLVSTVPLQVQATAGGWQLQGTAEMMAAAVHVNANEPAGVKLHFNGVQARLPLHAKATEVEIRQANIQTQAWQWSVADTTQNHPHFTLRASSQLDLLQQRLRLPRVEVVFGELGSGSGSGAWSWREQALDDLQLQFTSSAVATLWSNLTPLVPETYRAWQVQGTTHVEVQAPHLSLRTPWELPRLGVTWQLQDAAFSAPDSRYAGEQINGSMQATLSRPRPTEPYVLQGTLTLQPFALLVGSFFPALEANGITSVLTFTGRYQTPADHLQLDLAGQLSDIGTLTLQGHIHQPLSTPRYDLLGQLRQINAERFWHTFLHNTGLLSPALAKATAQGTLQAQLQVRGQPSAMHMQGHLELSDFHLHTDSVRVEGAFLQLPLDMRYPLPEVAGEAAVRPAAADGHLRIARLGFGGLQIEAFATRLALRSDSVVFPEDITVSLLHGRLRLRYLTAQHLLRPQRRVLLQAEVENLDLQRLQRDTGGLPLAGVVHGVFTRVHLFGDRLETVGSLTLQIAGGHIRVFDVQGRDLFSSIPTLQGSFATTQPLSLLQLTRIYPIGDISGTVHLRVDDLTLTAGEPAALHLTFHVQEKGGEAREITLRALNNLLFTTGSAKVAAGLLGDAYRLPYKLFGADITLRHDTLRLRGLYHDSKGLEYFMRAPTLGGGVSIVNRVPENGIPFRDFLQRLQATVVERPDVKVR